MERDLQIEVIRWGNQFDLSRIVRYLKEREKEQGGFMFAPELYPDVEDTYYGVRILQLPKADIDRDRTANP